MFSSSLESGEMKSSNYFCLKHSEYSENTHERVLKRNEVSQVFKVHIVKKTLMRYKCWIPSEMKCYEGVSFMIITLYMRIHLICEFKSLL